jgi:hypothetical protein
LTSSSSTRGRSYYLWYQFSFIFVSYLPLFSLYLMLTGQAKIIYFFYRHSCKTNEFLQSNGSLNRRRYFRILALACTDILLTLPLGVINTTTQVLSQTREPALGFPFRFYYGWSFVHSNWGPVAYRYSSLVGEGFWNSFELYFEFWASPILAITIFTLFGLSSEARVTYWRCFCAAAKLFGWTHPTFKDEGLGEIEFGVREATITERCVPPPFASDFPAYLFRLRSLPSFVVSATCGLDTEQGHGLN